MIKNWENSFFMKSDFWKDKNTKYLPRSKLIPSLKKIKILNNRVELSRQNRHIGMSGSINVDRVDTSVDQGQSKQFDRSTDVLFNCETWMNWWFISTVLTHEKIRVNFIPQGRLMSISGSILFDRVVTWVYQSQSMSTESTQVLIRVNKYSSTDLQTFCSIVKHEWTGDFFRQCWHMSISGSISIDRFVTWVYQSQSMST